MKKKIKKAFTLVELLVVIAILAILATVSIVGYNSFTKKAKVSNDTVLVKQMNDVLFANQQTDDKNNTMTEALEDVFGAGYDVEKLTPTTTNYNIVWDSENDQMVLLDDSKNVVYPTEKVTSKDKMFLITKTANDFTATKDEFAHYLTSEFTYDGTLAITTGLDVGSNTNVNNISYTGGETGKTISIRTNGGKLVVNGPKDTINHYGAADYTNIVAVYGESYHEFGVSAYARIASGHFVAESTAKVVNLNVASSDVKITENTGAKVNEYSKGSSDVVVKVNNTEKTVDTILNETNFENESKNSSVVAEGGVVEVNGVRYSTLESAILSNNNVTIKVTSNLEVKFIEIPKSKNITLDINGFSVKTKGNKTGHWSKIYGTLNLVGNGFFGDDTGASVGYLFDLYGNGKLIVGSYDLVIKCGLSCIQLSDSSSAEIHGGYWIGGDYNNTYWTINKIDSNKETTVVSIDGGKFENFDPSNSKTENPYENWVKVGYKCIDEKIGTSNNERTLYTIVKE